MKKRQWAVIWILFGLLAIWFLSLVNMWHPSCLSLQNQAFDSVLKNSDAANSSALMWVTACQNERMYMIVFAFSFVIALSALICMGLEKGSLLKGDTT